MKKILKFMFWGFVALVLMGIGLSMGGGGSESTDEPKAVEAEAKPKEAADPITKENFEKIKQGDSLTGEGGMTIQEVEALLGEPDSKMESQSGDIKMIDYSYIGKDFQTLSVNFTNGKVSFKMFTE